MTCLASIIIPISPAHYALSEDAISSAHLQTVGCEVIPVYDTQERGAAWARNEGARQANGLFVVFLDADDLLHTHFIERTVSAWIGRGGGRQYVYTDWNLPNGHIRYAPEGFNVFRDGMAHINTTLLPTSAWAYVGGYDESIRGGEDEDFYCRLTVAGMCGIRDASPLVNYRLNYGGSITNSLNNPYYEQNIRHVNETIYARYKIYEDLAAMCNCGSPEPPKGLIANEPFEGSMMVKAIYPPRHEVGVKTGIKYPRVGLGATLFVHRDDYAAKPQLWKPIEPPVDVVPDIDSVVQLMLESA